MNVRLAAAVAACLALPAFAQTAGPNKVAFPESWSQGVMYSQVDRHDIKQYRELWSTKAAVDAVKAGKPIPAGTVLTLVQYKAVVDDKGRVTLRPVAIGRNYGPTVEVLEGLATTDRLVLNPSDSLAEGDQVSVAKDPA